MDETYRRLKRQATGRNALSTLAGVFLIASLAFWGVLHWSVLVAPTGFAIPQIIVAIVMTLIYTFALPLLLSMLIPATPAGQLLQKTQWGTIGFWVIIPAVGFLIVHAYDLMLAWFSAQPLIADADLANVYTISALVAFVVIVALAWVQVSPDKWLQEIEQAHQVKKLELMQRGEIAILKARLAWVEAKAVSGYARLLPAEQQEVRDTLRGLLMAVSDTQRSIAQTMGIQADVERAVLGDEEIAQSLDYVSQQLERPAKVIDRALTYFDDGERVEDDPRPHHTRAVNEDTRLQSSIPREAQSSPGRRGTTGDDREYSIVIDHLRKPVWVAQDVADLLRIDKTTAQKKVRAWIAQELVEETRLGHYRFAEET